MKLKLLFLSLFLTQILSAQTFTEVPSVPGLDGIKRGSIAFGDVDGDNDLDVLITGIIQDTGNERISKLYTNDGLGNFSEVPDTPFDNVAYSSIAFVDVDGDNDLDVFISGEGEDNDQFERFLFSKLYTNDGLGNFSEVPDTPFVGVYLGDIAFADIDGDNDQDLLITGATKDGFITRVSRLYTNDGQGNFSEVTDDPFPNVRFNSVAFADVDGDNDQDLLITGQTALQSISKLYINDGLGNFSEMLGTPFFPGLGSSIFLDVDGDADQDILTSVDYGNAFQILLTSKLYINDGLGNFSEMTNIPFENSLGSIAAADVDGDNDQDLLFAGRNDLGDQIRKLYTNDGAGNFSEVLGTPFDDIGNEIAFADVDGDNDQDILITGTNSSNERTSKLFINENLVSTEDEILEFNFELILYPNPTASNHLNIGFTLTKSGFVIVRMVDVNGKLLSEQKKLSVTGPQTISVDISGLSAGSYFIHMENGKRVGVAKFVVP